MVLPRNSVAMSSNEMTYVEGGLSLKVNAGMLFRPYCAALGLKYRGTAGLSAGRIAAEIYAHARLYYGSLAVAPVVALAGLASSTVKSAYSYIKSHSNPINIGGDSATRVAIYYAIWALF
jgi:hypothetical protein